MNAKGLDVSHYNGTLSAALLSQIDFVIAKASEGAFHDAKYTDHSARTLKAGKVLGAYHFGTYGPGPTTQAQAFLSAAKNAAFLALDVEGDALHHLPVMRGIIANLHKFDTQHRWVGLYASDGNWPGDLGQDFDWPAHWDHEPNRPWRFWQYQGHPIDLDQYNGDVAHLIAWSRTRLR